MRVLFFGNGENYSLPFLETIVRSPAATLVGVVCPMRAPADPGLLGVVLRRAKHEAARALAALPEPVFKKASAHRRRFLLQLLRLAGQAGAPGFFPPAVNDPELLPQLRALNADVVVMAGFNQILKAPLIEAFPRVLNVHPSLLPAYRGPVPPFWIVSRGERESGVTVHEVETGIDSGAIVAQERFAVEPWLTGGELLRRSARVGSAMVADLLERLAAGRSLPKLPTTGEGSYFGRVAVSQLTVPVEQDLVTAFNRARAAAPFDRLHVFVPQTWWLTGAPGSTARATTEGAPGLVRVLLGDARMFPRLELGPPGTVLRGEAEGGLAVQCGGGALFFREATLAGSLER